MDSQITIPSGSVRNDEPNSNIERTVRLNRITSLRGAGTAHKVGSNFLCIPTKLSDDERWTNSIVGSGFSRALEHINEPTFECFLDKVVDDFSSAFHQPVPAAYIELFPSSCSLFDRNSKIQPFFVRKVADLQRSVGRVSRRQPSKTVFVVDDNPTPQKKPRGNKNLVDSSVASWGKHMESLALTQNSSLDDLRRSQTVSTRQADDFSLLHNARERENNELLRLEAVAQKNEDRREMKKRERE